MCMYTVLVSEFRWQFNDVNFEKSELNVVNITKFLKFETLILRKNNKVNLKIDIMKKSYTLKMFSSG